MKKIMILMFCLSLPAASWAQRRASGSSTSGGSRLTYDLGASTGSYGGYSYSEINLGLNWYFADWMSWRNAVFTRQGKEQNTTGLDTSLRFEYNAVGEDFGVKAFAGPGYRFASKSLSAAFAEAGLVFKLGGLSIGAGAKTMMYQNPGEDSSGGTLPKQDTSYFLILGGGGVL
ncbi:MAG: hypothetical protein KF681_07210 [Bdellovibrionaceae bacterium]|nr:hypothetical protein [Pseudobdellovibrionaceae bacterium]